MLIVKFKVLEIFSQNQCGIDLQYWADQTNICKLYWLGCTIWSEVIEAFFKV